MIDSGFFCFGRADTLVFSGEGGFQCTSGGGNDTFRPCAAGELMFLMDADPNFHYVPSVSIDEVPPQIHTFRQREKALFFFTASIDLNLERELRTESAELVDGYLQEQDTASWLLSTLLSKPSFVLPEAFTLSCPELTLWSGLANRVAMAQPTLGRLWTSLEDWLDQQSITEEAVFARDVIEYLRRDDWISRLAVALESKNYGAFNELSVTASLGYPVTSEKTLVLRALANVRVLLQQGEKSPNNNLTLFAQESEVEVMSTRSVPELSNFEAYTRVKKQIEGIRRLLAIGNKTAVDKAVVELISFHERHGDKEHLAKSLCNLTTISLDLNEPHIADVLSLRATELGIEDVIVETNRAEALKNLGRFDEAQAKYEAVLLKYGRDSHAVCGYADVLKDKENFAQASSVYATAIDLFPHDPVPYNGEVSVLVAQNKMDAALIKAKRNAAHFSDPVSKTVLGGVLRRMGRYAESARVLQSALREFPEEMRIWTGLCRSLVLGRNFASAHSFAEAYQMKWPDSPSPTLILGEISRAMGKLDDSLEWYTKALRKFPAHRPAQLGKATLLILLSRESEAEELLGGLDLESELDWIAFHALKLAQLRAGKSAEALEGLAYGISKCPWGRIRSMFSASHGLAKYKLGSFKDAEASFDIALTHSEPEKKNVLLLFLGAIKTKTGSPQSGRNLIEMAKPSSHSGRSLKAFFQHAGKKNFQSKVIAFPPAVENAAYDVLLAAA